MIISIAVIRLDAQLAAEAGRPITSNPYIDELASHHWECAYNERLADLCEAIA